MNCGDCKYSHDIGTAFLCWGQRFAPPVDADHWCAGWKPKSVTPQTHADRIRQMTDEELAYLLHDHSCSLCPLNYKCDGRVEVGRKKCKEYWLRWLQGPAEEVDE